MTQTTRLGFIACGLALVCQGASAQVPPAPAPIALAQPQDSEGPAFTLTLAQEIGRAHV